MLTEYAPEHKFTTKARACRMMPQYPHGNRDQDLTVARHRDLAHGSVVINT